ncbi:MAG: hypothetical protein V4723_01320 [Pseudomonadota bacterium]
MSTSAILLRSLFAAAAVLACSALLVWASPEHISEETARRLLGVLLGAVVVAYSNSIPKVLAARARLRCSAAEEQAARRFAGWSLVLGGLAYVLAWMVAPLSVAGLIGGALLAIGVALALLRCLRLGSKGSLT